MISGCGLDSTGSGKGTAAFPCEYDKELSVSIKVDACFEQLTE